MKDMNHGTALPRIVRRSTPPAEVGYRKFVIEVSKGKNGMDLAPLRRDESKVAGITLSLPTLSLRAAALAMKGKMPIALLTPEPAVQGATSLFTPNDELLRLVATLNTKSNAFETLVSNHEREKLSLEWHRPPTTKANR
jgi:hypothetical protein